MRKFIRKFCNNLAYDNNYEFFKESIVKMDKIKKYFYEEEHYFITKNNNNKFIRLDDYGICKKCNGFGWITYLYKNKTKYVICSDCR
tara:strand:+ start:843 stop:1103 length:261 start_codon:yes stop_codon:yes gene_type:complete